MADRVRFAGGDVMQDTLPGGFDVAACPRLDTARAWRPRGGSSPRLPALPPGGLRLIQEFIVDDDRNGPVHPALFDLNKFVGTLEGQSFTQGELTGMMEAAGLASIRRLPAELPQGCGIMVGIAS